MKKKQIAIAFLIIGIVGFIISQNQKEKYLVFEKRISSNIEFVQKIYAQAGNNYLFSFWGNDEQGALQEWADMEFILKIETSTGEIIEEKKIVASGSGDDGGIKRAANGDDVKYSAKQSGDLILTTTLTDGDYLDIEVYENLPENTYWMPVLFIAFFITGLVLFMKARASVNIQGKPIQTKTKKSK